MSVYMVLRNSLYSIADHIDRPKPYELSFSTLSIYKDTEWGDGEFKFWIKIEVENEDGSRCDVGDNTDEALVIFTDKAACSREIPNRYNITTGLPGGRVRVTITGTELDRKDKYNDHLGTIDRVFNISPGAISDEDYTFSNEYFGIHLYFVTMNPPPNNIRFSSEDFTHEDNEMQLIIAPNGNWSFEYKIAWAGTFTLQQSFDRENWQPVSELWNARNAWEEVRELTPEEQFGWHKIEGNFEVSHPDEGWSSRYFRLHALNHVNELGSASEILHLIVGE
jgi:hypothetical protein